MRMKGRPIRAAVSSQFMVDPSVRNRLAAVELQSAFFAGPQDLSFTDGANEASRKIWEGLGGLTAFPYSVHWTRLLRPTRYFLGRWRERGLSTLTQWALRPASAVADFLATHRRRSPFHQAEHPPEEDLSWETLLEELPKFAAKKSLCPEYDEQSLRWLMEQANEKKCHGSLRKAVVRNSGGQVVGWNISYPAGRRMVDAPPRWLTSSSVLLNTKLELEKYSLDYSRNQRFRKVHSVQEDLLAKSGRTRISHLAGTRLCRCLVY